MSTELQPPTKRECERCGRQDVWDESLKEWQITVDDDGNRIIGNPHCIHEWDINGTHNPFGSVD